MKRLIVYVPGLFGTTKTWQSLLARLKQEPGLEDATWLPCDHHCTPFSRRRALTAAVRICAAIDAEWAKSGPFDEIVLLGHSAGGVFVRQAFLIGAGAYPQQPAGYGWHQKVHRIVLLAAVNRGVDPRRSFGVRLAVRLAKFAKFFGWRMLLLDLLAGGNALTDLRIRWIRHFAGLADDAPTVVQLLGVNDELVERDDSYDVEQFPNAFHIRVDVADHGDIHRIDKASDPDARYAVIRSAILDAIPNHQTKPEKERVAKVVFIVHGIRDTNLGWVADLKRRLEERAAELGESVFVYAPSYGWFSLLDFAFPHRHRRPIREIQNVYSTCLADHPNAEFHFIGHSNGTYIVGQMLRGLRGLRFRRVFLAGSVLPRQYDWESCFDNQQVEIVRNDLACRDIPVGWVCNALRGLGRRSIGTAGTDGFLQYRDNIEQFGFHDGGHADALAEDNRESIVKFILEGAARPDEKLLVESKSKTFDWISRASLKLSWFPAAVALGGIAVLFATNWIWGAALLGSLGVFIYVFGETV